MNKEFSVLKKRRYDGEDNQKRTIDSQIFEFMIQSEGSPYKFKVNVNKNFNKYKMQID